jgi:hypothetical protein
MTWTGADLYCDNCRCFISGTERDAVHDSLCYAPNVRPGYDLCGGCAADEEAEEEQRGSNDMPERVNRYRSNRAFIERGDDK